ncbi:ABC transporter substrate-binding protein [Actinotalea sp. K2]|uniref:ABC transporter substrate-binding protein n=1 Tax=Actinotalea sp. K2 TaxID=2939438 RepID=UPI002018270D|nr:extracellular solute-binding protein [Actinotalea sp. K2]MCL3862140.1 extracellular solute-binding protein [Actinotalea sp. K2]
MLSSRSRRGVAFGATAAAVSLVLAACSSSGSAGSGSGGDGDPVTLRVGWYGGEPVHAAMEEALDQYEAENPGVTVEVSRAAFADYFDRLATETAGRSAPDVTRMSMSFFADYAGRGSLLALDDLVGETIQMDALDPDVRESGVLNGEYFGVPQSAISHALVVNPELIESLGAETPSSEWTWDEFGDWSKQLGQANPGFYGTSDMGNELQAFEVFVRQNGAELFTDDGTALGFDQAVLEEWWTYWQSMREESGAPPAEVTAEGGGFESSALTQGIAATTYAWVQQIVFFQELNEDTLELQPMPRLDGGDPGQFLKALDFWSIASTSEHPQEAAELVNFLLNDPAAVESIGLTLGVPPSQAARDTLDTDESTSEGEAVSYVEGLGEDRVGPPPGPWPRGYGELMALFEKMGEDVAFGMTDVTGSATQFFQESERVLGGY